jgi:ribosomal protein S18 acetylase RimI-like enzyme
MIRKAKIEDSKSLLSLSEELGNIYNHESLLKNLSELLCCDDHIILVIEIENDIVGFVHGQIYRLLYKDKMANILGLVVSNKYRKLGYGKALMNEIEKWAKSAGCKGIRLNSGSHREAAHKFYEAIGYSLWKEQKNFYKQI